MNKIVPIVMRNYIAYLVSIGKLVYMKYSETTPTVKITNTQYFWAKDITGYYDFCWHGPNAYGGDLPEHLIGTCPEWNNVLRFSRAYEKRLESDSWSKDKKMAHKISDDWIYAVDQIKVFCDANKWSTVVSMFSELNKTGGIKNDSVS